eukprot:11799299-Ditylum_brightwellii.AAC.1
MPIAQDLPPPEYHLMSCSLPRLLTLSVPEKRTWLCAIKLAHACSLASASLGLSSSHFPQSSF